MDMIQKYMDDRGLNKDILLNKNEWRRIIHVINLA